MARKQPTPRQLAALLEASKLLNCTLETEELLRRIIDAARTLSRADRATLYLVDDEAGELCTHVVSGPSIQAFRMPLGVGIAGHVVATGRASMLKDAYRSPHFNRSLDRKTGYRTRSMLTVPFHRRGGRVMGAMQAINHLGRGKAFGPAELTALEHLGDYAALALENARTVEELRQKRRMEEDLIAARTIQHNLLPHSLPTDERLDLAACYVPCLEVGGDCYDVLRVGNDGVGLALGDISGKGVTAAMMMANLQALFRLEARRGGAPHEVVSTMNRMFYESTQVHHFATFFYGILDLADHRLRYCSAGHEPILQMRGDGSVADVERGGVLLGVVPEFAYATQELPAAAGDVFVVYSDGITEQTGGKAEMFGREGLVEVVREVRHCTAAEIVEAIVAAVQDCADGEPAADDFTLVVFRPRSI